MNSIKFTLCGASSASISIDSMDKLIKEADGALCLMYLYILRVGDEFSLEDSSKALNLTSQETEHAILRLTALGLILPVTSKPLSTAPEVPEYTSAEVSHRGAPDLGFRILLSETQRIFGRILSGQELRQLFGIYDHLGLPAEVMLTLVNYCVAEYAKKYGPGRPPSLRSIEKEGIAWADLELLTLDRAEEHIQRLREASSSITRLKRSLGLNSRELTLTEKKYIESWLELGFPAEAIEIAYDRTILKTGSLKWSYMNSIIKNWHEKNLHTPAEIQLSDKPSPARKNTFASPVSPPAEDAGAELERTRKIIDIIRNG